MYELFLEGNEWMGGGRIVDMSWCWGATGRTARGGAGPAEELKAAALSDAPWTPGPASALSVTKETSGPSSRRRGFQQSVLFVQVRPSRSFRLGLTRRRNKTRFSSTEITLPAVLHVRGDFDFQHLVFKQSYRFFVIFLWTWNIITWSGVQPCSEISTMATFHSSFQSNLYVEIRWNRINVNVNWTTSGIFTSYQDLRISNLSSLLLYMLQNLIWISCRSRKPFIWLITLN